MAQRHLNEEELKDVCAMYTQGKDAVEIAAKHGVHKNTVYTVLERCGMPLRRQRRDYLGIDEITEIRRLYEEEGLSYQAIADRLKLSYRTVEKYGKRAGVASRPAGFQMEEKHPNWNGGRVTSHPDGYVQVLLRPDHPFYSMTQKKADGVQYVLEHRLVMAQKLGRALEDRESVHHIDGNRQNNHPDNLQLRQGKHGSGTAFCCADCGSHNIVSVPLIECTH